MMGSVRCIAIWKLKWLSVSAKSSLTDMDY
jgi:hypothetical protein